MNDKMYDTASWDTVGPELGEGEYTVRLYGPTEHTAWTMIYDAMYSALSPMAAAQELLIHRKAALVASLSRWRITVQAGRWHYGDEYEDQPILIGTFTPNR